MIEVHCPTCSAVNGHDDSCPETQQKSLSMFTWFGDPDPLCPGCGSEDLHWRPDLDGARCRGCGRHSSEADLAGAVVAWLEEHR